MLSLLPPLLLHLLLILLCGWGRDVFMTIAHRSVNGAGAVDSECDPKSYQPHAFSGAL